MALKKKIKKKKKNPTANQFDLKSMKEKIISSTTKVEFVDLKPQEKPI